MTGRAMSWQDLTERLHRTLATQPPEKLGKNGIHLAGADVAHWAFELNAIQLMAPSERDDPIHFDGGASLLLMALTLWGSRKTCLIPVPSSGQEATRDAVEETVPEGVADFPEVPSMSTPE